ncbi:MAG: hypothetical protein Q4B67_02000 [Eubacteriales bacterium]|nr:hypothetical protein [Eubacteriales bacterium]
MIKTVGSMEAVTSVGNKSAGNTVKELFNTVANTTGAKDEGFMNRILQYIDSRDWKANKKYKVAMAVVGTIFGILGLIAWLLIRPFALSTIDWMFCFIGYPALVACFVLAVYSCTHEFHTGSYPD